MTDKLDELVYNERLLSEKSDQDNRNVKKIKQLLVDYSDYFSKTTRFYGDLQDEFHQTDSSRRFEVGSDRTRQTMCRITENMEELNTYFIKEQQLTSKQLEAIIEEKKRLLASEQEETK